MRISGKYAYVDGVSCVGAWSASEQSSVQRYAASCAPDGTVTSDGNVSWSGGMEGAGYLPPFPTEDDIPFVGVASAKPGHFVTYEGDVLVSDCSVRIPKAQGGPITWVANWAAQGLLTKSTSTQYLDDTRELAPSAKNAKVTIETTLGSNTFTEVDEVQDVTLTFRRPLVDSVSEGAVYREPGNLEADISFSVNNDDLEVALYALNSVRRVRVYVTDTLYFLFDSIQFGALGNYRVQRNPVAMVGYQVNGMWTALRTRSPAALGEILLPGGAVLYGGDES